MTRFVDLLRELRDRRMFQIGLSYLAAGWVLLQVVSQLVAHGLVPNVVYIIVLIWCVGALPGVLMIGWFHGERGDQKAPRVEVFGLSVLGIVLLGLSSVAVSNHYSGQLAAAAAEEGMKLNRVAVLYFRDLTRGGEMQYLADGLTEDLIAELDGVKALEVVSRNGVAQFRSADIPQDSIAAMLGVGTIVDGTVERVGEEVRINIRLLDALSGAEFRRAAFERPVADVFAIRDEVARETARFLREWLGDEIQLRQLARETESPAAWALYNRAEKVRKDAAALARGGDGPGATAAFRRADSLLAQVQVVDTAWTDPAVLRATIAHDLARLVVHHDPAEGVRLIGDGMSRIEPVLRRSPRHPEALEARGRLRYLHWLLDVTPDPAERAALLQGARADLEAAVEEDPSLAGAHSTLSHLYFRQDRALSVIAARKAYEEDAYLDAADGVLWRLFTGNYDLAEFTQARRWCDEGARRFPSDYRFTECRLWLLTTRAESPDVAQAWELAHRLDGMVPEPRRPYERALSRILVGGVLGRAGLADSARNVMARARAEVTPVVDPSGELLQFEAHMHTLAGDYATAIELLKRYAAMQEHYSFEHHWWWQELRGRPEFAPLRADH